MKSIRRQLGLSLIIGLLAMGLIAGGILYSQVRRALLRDFDEALIDHARSAAAMVERKPDGKLELEVDPTTLAQLMPGSDGQLVQVWQSDGSVFMRSPSLGNAFLQPLNDSPGPQAIRDMTLPDGRAGRAIQLRFVPRPDPVPENRGTAQAPRGPESPSVETSVLLVLARSREPVDAPLSVLLSWMIAVGVGLTVVLVGLVLIVLRRGLSPLDRLAQAVAGMDVEQLSRRFESTGMPIELEPIRLRLNDLLARLDAAFKRERRFSADVAHELRTPVAELRALAEVALKWQGDPGADRQALQEALDIAVQLDSLIVGLLATIRDTAPKPQWTQVDIAPLLGSLLARCGERASSRHVKMRVQVPPTCVVRSDAALLGAILRNLISNAEEYTPSDGQIQCDLSVESDRCRITLCNDTTLTDEDATHLDEPFWRKDSARTSGSHCGLGLSIVKSFAHQLGIDVAIKLLGDRKLQVTLLIHLGTPATSTRTTTALSRAVVLLLVTGFASLAGGCATYEPRPIDPAANQSAFEARTLTESWNAVSNGVPAPRTWNLNLLTLIALHEHPDIEVARAHVAEVEAATITAGQRPNPSLAFSPQAALNPDAMQSPWTIGLDLDIPIETAGKRQIRINQASAQADTARWELYEAAWRVRQGVRTALAEYLVNSRALEAIKDERLARQKVIDRITSRVKAGQAPASDLLIVRIDMNRTILEEQAALSQLQVSLAALAQALGLPESALQGAQFADPSLDVFPTIEQLDTHAIQRATLINRLDVRRSLSEYAAAEAALELEVAKQYPDIHLGPGYQFDQGQDKVTLGISFDLPILNQNQGPIAEAQAHRRTAGAILMQVQAQAIGHMQQTMAAYRGVLAEYAEAAELATSESKQIESVRRAVEAGQEDSLALDEAQLVGVVAERLRVDVLRKVHASLADLEDALQRPLSEQGVMLDMPDVLRAPFVPSPDQTAPPSPRQR